MQYLTNQLVKKIFLCILSLITISISIAQVSSVEYGKNRLQYKKFNWQYYQTKNFNTYFSQNGQELAKYVAQVAEKELPGIENFIEYSLQRRANIVIYNSFNDMKQSNIGMGIDWQNTGGVTKLVNNKMLVYFNGDHNDLKKQVREGLARVLTENVLFGDDLGEVAGNQALLDLPQWLTDGYIAYAGQNWSTALDDDLKSEMLSGKYNNFYQLAFERPLLAGHAFWYYIEEKYKKENTTYLLYLARVYKNLNKASLQIAKKKFKNLLADFMEYEGTKYDKDVSHRRNYPKGSEITSATIGKRVDYFHFNVNPNKRNSSFAVVQFKKGQYKVILNEEDQDKVLLKFDVLSNANTINPNYPMMAWDGLGKRLAVLYGEQGKIKLFVYDAVIKSKPYLRDLTPHFDQVQDIKYMPDYKRLVMSAVKNGHTDIFTYDIENDKVKQITNDIYDDLDPSYVSLPNKEGIIFSSNRPSPYAKSADTVLPNNHYNIFLVTDFATNKAELNRVSQLTNLKFGDARYPTQYNSLHFTFVNDENGIGNRYAGFFSSFREGFDTLVVVGEDILRNPTIKQVDSLLRANKKQDVDTIAVVSVSKDSAYIFPLTNYASTLLETRAAGENNQVSEVTRQSDDKILYKLKIDENTLRRRNVNNPPTAYMKRILQQDKISTGQEMITRDSTKKQDDIFQNEFGVERKDTANSNGQIINGHSSRKPSVLSILSTAKLYAYKPPKFATDYLVSGFNNSVLVNRFQKYQGGQGPIQLSSSTPLNGIVRIGTSDIMEDIKFSGGYRLSTNLKDNDWLFQFQNLRRKLDWGFTYYRNVISGSNGKLISNLYQGNIIYPFDEVKSLRLNLGVRRDRLVFYAFDPATLNLPEDKTLYGLAHLEFVYDNTLNPAQNIWNGSRYKIYTDLNRKLNGKSAPGTNTGFIFNAGFDGRTYYPIYRNFIWAGRAAADFSWGKQKLIYYLGGVDNWLMFGENEKLDKNGQIKYKYFNPNNPPDPDNDYAFQSLAVNMRGFIQNVANGNNAMVINSEFRLPVFTTLFSKPINNAFLRNFQLIQFIDLGTAWNGKFDNLKRPSSVYGTPPVQVNIKNGGIGPFVGGYGFGARSTLLGYFIKADAGWQMNGFFKGKPILYFSMGLDF
ncbi:MAG TPA: hypothetical protein VGP43_04275 [Chitinophagaceae bacterium]|nr:hypothetical protein [Chitinophagaceae bacterium]